MILWHQGYAFHFVTADGGFDGPVFHYVEGDSQIKKSSESFAKMLSDELSMMEEQNDQLHQTGGYFLTVQNGVARRNFPAHASGIRPLDMPDAPTETRPWWRFW